jgi:dienelactone hydrolase
MPVVLWANGGCGGVGTFWMAPLVEWASHGIMVIADGNPAGSPSTGRDTADLLRKSLAWLKTAPAKYPFLDTSRIGVSGQSCGGLLAYDVANDPGITSVGIFNSGGLQAAQSKLATQFKNPTAYFLGGSTDIAYANVRYAWSPVFYALMLIHGAG